MKYITTHLFITILLLCSCIFLHAESPKREFRATWLAAVGVDWPDNKVTSSSSSSQISAQKSELVGYLNTLVATNQNAICYHVRPMADAFYTSNISLVPWSKYLTNTRGQSPGYDPLAYAIEEAHARGLELHAWINPFRYEGDGTDHGTNDPIRKQHPDWILDYTAKSKGTILDPANPEVRAHIVEVVQEIVDNYDVDGIIFDDYFYPYGGTTTEDAASQTKWNTMGMNVDDWRRENIDKTIKAVYDMIANSSKPWVRFGISPFGIWTTDTQAAEKYGVTLPAGITGSDNYKEIACNTLSWMQGGYVDYVSPQLYWPTTQKGQEYNVLAQWWSNMAKHFTQKLPGKQNVHFFSSQDVSAKRGSDTDEIASQIDYNRQYDKLDAPGSIFFSYDDFVDRGMSAVTSSKFSSRSLPPAMNWKAFTALEAPAVSRSGSKLSWTHPTATRFTVYAYTKGMSCAEAIANPANLVQVVYGKSLDVSSVSGYSSKTFAVCAYDRYGNEHPAGIYNGNALSPSLTASATAITLSGEQNQPNPYYDITITGKDLSASLTITTSGAAAISAEAYKNWDNYTGGTLRITLDATQAVGEYTGTVTVTNGTQTQVINVTADVTVRVPELTASATSVTLSGVQETTPAAYQDIIIKGKALDSDIVITNTNSAILCEYPSAWDSRTGGTLRVRLSAYSSVGTHEGTITITGGGETVTIHVSATLFQPVGPTDPDNGTLTLTEVWTKTTNSAASNYVSYLGTGNNNRSIAYYGDRLYVPVYSDKKFHIINAATGALISTQTLGTMTYSGHSINVCMTDDGQLLAGNTGTGSSYPLEVYIVDKSNGGSTSQKVNINIGRSDFFDVYGSWNGSGYIVSFSNAGIVAYTPFTNGTLQTAKVQELGLSAGISAKALPDDATSFYVQGSEMIPVKYALNGSTFTKTEEFGERVRPKTDAGVSGMAVFTLGGAKYMITPTNSLGSFQIFDITNGLGNAKLRKECTTIIDGKIVDGEIVTNGCATVDFAVDVQENDAYIYILVPNRGIAKYKLTFTPSSFTVSPKNVTLSGEEGVSDVYKDVTISGSNLPVDITIDNQNEGVTYECLDGWNVRTGGTLRIRLNTSKPGTYSGNVILQSGTASVMIAVTGTVIALEPGIQVLGSAAVDLSGEQEATGIYKDVTIKGVLLDADLTITNTNSAVTWECLSGWNAREGGTLRLKLNTSTLGTYSGIVRLASGAYTTEIAVTAEVEEPRTEDDTPLDITPSGTGTFALDEEPLWIKKDADVDYISGTDSRSIAYYDGLLYIPDYGEGRLYKVNASDGSQNSSVTLGLTSYHRLNVRITDDGQMLGGSTNLTSTLTIHTVNKGTGSATALAPTATVGGRSDYFHTYGSWQDGGYALALSNVNTIGTKVTFSGGKITTSVSIDHDDLPTGTSAIAVPAPDGQSFYAAAQGEIPTQHDFTGKKIASFGSGTLVQEASNTSGLGVFTFKERTYMLAPLNRFGKFKLFDITEGLANAKLIGERTPAFDNNANAAVIVDFCTYVEGNNAYIYVLAPNNGVAAYKFTYTPDEQTTYDCVFTGASGSLWLDPANWEGGKMPSMDDHVLIKAPCEVLDGGSLAKSVNILKNSGKLTIGPEGALTVASTIRCVEDKKFPPTTRYYTSTSDITIQADAKGNQGVLAYFGEGKTRATVELYGVYKKPDDTKNNIIPWQYIAMPFAIPNAADPTVGFSGSWITEWNEPEGKWNFKNGTTVSLETWKGYALIQSEAKKYTLTGTLQEPTTSGPLPLYMRDGASENQDDKGSNFIGNSWTAPLKISKLIETGFSGSVQPAVYLHQNQLNGTDYEESYTTFTSSNAGENVINPLQGFFVLATATGGTITLNYADLVSNTTQLTLNSYRLSAVRGGDISIGQSMKITVTGDNGFYTKVSLYESEDYTTDFDNGYDAHKLHDSKGVPYLAAASVAGDMAVLATPEMSGTYLNFERGSGARYTFTFSYEGEERLYLLDAVTGVSVEIAEGSSYTFSPTADDHYRFRLSRKTIQEGALDEIDMWANGRKLYFTNSLGLPTDIWVYGVDGRLVEHSVTRDRQHLLSVPSAGVYVICVSNEQGTQTIQVIL